jgi:hypothetical protein
MRRRDGLLAALLAARVHLAHIVLLPVDMDLIRTLPIRVGMVALDQEVTLISMVVAVPGIIIARGMVPSATVVQVIGVVIVI